MTPNPTPNENKKGLIYALACYIIWGVFPLYWYPLTHSDISPSQLLAWRIVFSSIFALATALILGQGRILLHALTNRRILFTFFCSAAMITINWLVYLWAISENHVLDASLGYFILPLFSILLGRIFFQEALNRTQLAAIILASIGVLWLAIPAGHIPWVAILLTLSFGIYGLIRKLAPLPALPGLVLETLIILPFAAAFLYWEHLNHTLIFNELPTLPMLILIGSGAVTTIPLLLFAAAATRISLSNMGMLQYISPTCQLIIGLTVFQEDFNLTRFIGYMWVWAGIVVYLIGLTKRKT